MNSTYIIAEIGINHNGDISLAKKLISKAAESGANAVKFQKRTIDVVYSAEELSTYRESPWGTTNREQKEGLEFDIEVYKELYAYSKGLGLDFIVSCWDIPSVDLIENNINVDYHKVASALATDTKFLEKINQTGKPVILSTGMCTDTQVKAARSLLSNVEYILACTSTYPSVDEEINLCYISTLSQQYPDLRIGFSNHYSGHDASTGAIALGASLLEFHITSDRTMYGSDQAASIEDAQDLIHGIRSMEIMLGDGKKQVYEKEKSIIKKLRKVDDTTQ
jgi:N-acetylneuraminate synthase